MPRCRACSADIPPASRFCLKCGAPVAAADPGAIETVAMETPAATPRPQSASMLHSGSGIPVYRFEPGTLLASRYRVISRVGKGGMGEVFRADDILLGQSVALKFLPESAKGNLSLLTRFYDEVRIARQITHPNVCRVYDIGEVEGQPYLSMEYMDGEDLGSLLRRIGRLPADKATEFARKMCAGLAAAHKQGVLHRDLKPANVMIDGQGELRIMDFGLAAVATQLEGSEARSGTPAYMAPEQLEGREVSVQSDLYALGLVFYEMFTGKPAHRADSVADILKLRQNPASLTNPSQLASDIDPAVERAILRCLNADPKQRPASAMALAASLPGGDPLAAALAAGETPSPEVVAASGSTEGLHARVAVLALAGVVAGLAVACWIAPKVQLAAYVPFENPLDALSAKAREIVQSLGYTERPVDFAPAFYYDTSAVRNRQVKGGPTGWADQIAKLPSPVLFAYRQSPAPLVSQRHFDFGRVNGPDPFPNLSGMVSLSLDPSGRLMAFDAVPPQLEEHPTANPVDWAPLFAAARLDAAQFHSAEPHWTPLAATDARAAWTGTYRVDQTAGASDLPLRVEAAAFHGRVVHFELVWPWTRPTRMPSTSLLTPAQRASNFAGTLLFLVIMAVALWLAYYNYKAGRSDLRGAARLGVYMASVSLLKWILGAHHVGAAEEQNLVTAALSEAAYAGVRYWIFYLAMEPWVRRYWPQTLVTWSRLLGGRWRDPLVGRDVLFGILLGAVYLLFFQGFNLLNVFSGSAPDAAFGLQSLNGTRYFGYLIATHLDNAISVALYFFLMLFILRALLRKQWLAGLVFVLIHVALRSSNQSSYYGPLFTLAIFGTIVLVMLRFGVFATMVLAFVVDTTSEMVFTTDFGAWYGQSSWIFPALLVAAAVWAFRTSLGGKPLLGPAT